MDAMMYLKNEQRAVQWSGGEKLRNKGLTHATDRQHSTVAIFTMHICFYDSTFCLYGNCVKIAFAGEYLCPYDFRHPKAYQLTYHD